MTSDPEFKEGFRAWCDGELSIAIDEALKGNSLRLARLMREEPLFSTYSWDQLAAFFEGNFNPPRGRPNRSAQGSLFEEERVPKPVDLAAKDFDRIIRIWRLRYKRKSKFRDEAIEKAADRHGVSFDTLKNYLGRRKLTQ